MMAKKCLFIRGRPFQPGSAPLSSWVCVKQRLEVSWLYLLQRVILHAEKVSLFFFFPWACSVAYWILFQQPGIEPRPSAVKVLLPNYWTTKEVPEKIFLSFSFLWELKGIQLVADSEGKERESQSLGKSIRLVKWPPVSCRISARQLSLLICPDVAEIRHKALRCLASWCGALSSQSPKLGRMDLSISLGSWVVGYSGIWALAYKFAGVCYS